MNEWMNAYRPPHDGGVNVRTVLYCMGTCGDDPVGVVDFTFEQKEKMMLKNKNKNRRRSGKRSE